MILTAPMLDTRVENRLQEVEVWTFERVIFREFDDKFKGVASI